MRRPPVIPSRGHWAYHDAAASALAEATARVLPSRLEALVAARAQCRAWRAALETSASSPVPRTLIIWEQLLQTGDVTAIQGALRTPGEWGQLLRSSSPIRALTDDERDAVLAALDSEFGLPPRER